MKSLRDYINLVSETNLLSEKVTLNPDGSVPQTQTVNGVTMNAPANAVQTGSGGVLKTGSGAAVTSGTPAPAPDAAAAAKAKLSPEQLKWLGGADPTDPIIMARLKKAVPDKPAAPAQAAQPAPAAAAPAPAADAPLSVPPGAEPDAAPEQSATGLAEPTDADVAGGPSSVNAQGQNVTMPDGTNPETGEKTQTAAAPAAPAQAAQPAPAAKPKVMAKSDPAVLKLQQDLIARGAKIKADGVMGPATQAAQKQFGANQTAATAARTGVAMNSQAGAGRGTVVPPVAKESRTARNDHAFIDELNAMRSIAGLPTKNKW